MAILRHSCDGPDGVTVTTTDAPAGSDNWRYATVRGGGTLAYDTSRAKTGTSSIHFRLAAAADVSSVRWENPDPVDPPRCVAAFHFYYSSATAPIRNHYIADIRDSAGSWTAILSILADRRLEINGPDRHRTVASQPLQPDTWNWIVLETNPDTQTLRAVVERDGAEVPGESIVLTGVDFYGRTADHISLGPNQGSSTDVIEYWLDDISVVFGAGDPYRPELPAASADTLVYNGSAFVPGEVLTWDGAAFVPAAAVKTWDGQQWGPA